MQQSTRTLSLKTTGGSDLPEDAAPEVHMLGVAIARKACIAAVYNKASVELAPHIIYTRHDELFIDGIVVERDGKPPREIKLGTFKLAGLKGIMLTGRSFTRGQMFDPADPKYDGKTLCVVAI